MLTPHRSKDGRVNNLLRALRPADLALLEPHLVEMTLASGTVLYEPGDNVQKVYFPCDSTLLIFRIQLDDGRAVETALVGREGAVAGIVSQGRLPAYSRAEVHLGGPLLSMDIEDLEEAKMKSLVLRHIFARYADCLMAQVFQSVACNAAHSIEQRAAKWLVSAMDRTNDASLPMTQEQLAGMLGVGRSYVSRVIQTLKHRRLIETQRGVLTVVNPHGLSHLACSCHTAVRRHFDEVLKGVYPDNPIVGADGRLHSNETG
ncbi:MAG TPA: Crp/Fnr family transcriptional regulator [Kaistia sp.]|nr:Crp/Fnr family transcriptional regulator [Kaistia sp.]